MSTTVSPKIAKFVLKTNGCGYLLVMCRGYGDDDENLTELVWADDKYLDFCDRDTYPEFQIWIMGDTPHPYSTTRFPSES